MVRILHLKTGQTGPFKTLVEVLKEMLPEATIEFQRPENGSYSKKKNKHASESGSDSEDESAGPKSSKKVVTGGMKIMSTDLTKTILIYLKLDANQFGEFECKKSKYPIGVNMSTFYKLIKTIEKDDSLTLFVDSNDSDNLNINIETNKGITTDVKMKLMDLEEEELHIPPTDFQARVIMPSVEFSKICKEMHGIAELMEIKCTNNNVVFTARGDGAQRRTNMKEQENNMIIDFAQSNKNKIIQGIFELKHLVWFSKCANLCSDIEIFMKNDYALVIKYSIASLGRLLLCLTPIKHRNDEDSEDESDDDSEIYDDENIKMK